MADIFNEIDEELRRDKAQAWWKQYGKFVIAACAVVIAGTAGYTWHQESRTAELRDLADRYGQAQTEITAGNNEQAIAALNTLATDAQGEGIAMVAGFRAAGLLGEQGDHTGSAAAYEALAADSDLDNIYRNLASVMAVLQASLAGEDPKVLLDRLAPQTEEEAAWRFTARMIAASLAVGAGDMKAAADYLKAVADDADAPTSARGQAAEMLQALGE